MDLKWKLILKKDDLVLDEFDIPHYFALKVLTLQYKPYAKGNLTASRRLEVLERDNNKCCVCGKTEKEIPLAVHHILPESDGGSAELNNLITLCFLCHKKEHYYPILTSERSLYNKYPIYPIDEDDAKGV